MTASSPSLTPIASEEGLGLFDSARAAPEPLAVAVPLQRAALGSLERSGMLPPLFSELVSSGPRRSKAQSGSLARRLATIPEAEREAAVLALVREHAAAVLGHDSVDAIDPEANFKDLGFDSLGAVELRNRLAQATGVSLEATAMFDHPSAEAVARHLLAKVEGEVGGG